MYSKITKIDQNSTFPVGGGNDVHLLHLRLLGLQFCLQPVVVLLQNIHLLQFCPQLDVVLLQNIDPLLECETLVEAINLNLLYLFFEVLNDGTVGRGGWEGGRE